MSEEELKKEKVEENVEKSTVLMNSMIEQFIKEELKVDLTEEQWDKLKKVTQASFLLGMFML